MASVKPLGPTVVPWAAMQYIDSLNSLLSTHCSSPDGEEFRNSLIYRFIIYSLSLDMAKTAS